MRKLYCIDVNVIGFKCLMLLVSIAHCAFGGLIPEGKSCPETKSISQEILIKKIEKGTDSYVATVYARPQGAAADRLKPDKGLILLTAQKDLPIDLLIDKANVCQGCHIVPFKLSDDAFSDAGQKVSLSISTGELLYLSSMGYSCDLKTRSAFQFFNIDGVLARIQGDQSVEAPFVIANLLEDRLSVPSRKYVSGEIFIPKSFYGSVGYSAWVNRTCEDVASELKAECEDAIKHMSSYRLGVWIDNERIFLNQSLCSPSRCSEEQKLDEFSKRFKSYVQEVTGPSGSVGVLVYFQIPSPKKEFIVNFDRLGKTVVEEMGITGLGRKGWFTTDPGLDYIINMIAEKVYVESPGAVSRTEDAVLFSNILVGDFLASGMNYADIDRAVSVLDFKGKSLKDIAKMVRTIPGQEKKLSWREFPDDGDVGLFRNTWSRLRLGQDFTSGNNDLVIASDDFSLKIATKNDDGSMNELMFENGSVVLAPSERRVAIKNGIFVMPTDQTSENISSTKVVITSMVSGTEKKQQFRLHVSREDFFTRKTSSEKNSVIRAIRAEYPGNVKSGETARFIVGPQNVVISKVESKKQDSKITSLVQSQKRELAIAGVAGDEPIHEVLGIEFTPLGSAYLKYYREQNVFIDSKRMLLVLGYGMPYDLVIHTLRKTIGKYYGDEMKSGLSPDVISISDHYQSALGVVRKMKINAKGETVDGFGISPYEFTSAISDGDYDSVVYLGHGMDFSQQVGFKKICGSPAIGAIKGDDKGTRGPTLYLGVHDFHGESPEYRGYVKKGTIFDEVVPRKKGTFLSIACLGASNIPKGKVGTGEVWNSMQYISRKWGWESAGSENYVYSFYDVVKSSVGGKEIAVDVWGECEKSDRHEGFPVWNNRLRIDGSVCFLPSELTDHQLRLRMYKWKNDSFDISDYMTPPSLQLTCVPKL